MPQPGCDTEFTCDTRCTEWTSFHLPLPQS